MVNSVKKKDVFTLQFVKLLSLQQTVIHNKFKMRSGGSQRSF